ncbi:P-loop containing nucleoside triphosphate hydrolase protein [Scheffersomyces xylosifermentans]|uniref:P-loop containing nucleoside triphosphate hydrolase protein n=1 Tax=Scheffersomyces xylosifermentans TaxID=1304137 RepID=UPI00315D2998
MYALRSVLRIRPVRSVRSVLPISRNFGNSIGLFNQSNTAQPIPENPVATPKTSPPEVVSAPISKYSVDELAKSGKFDKTIIDALKAANFRNLTPVQETSLIPILEENGLVVRAKTGTGKTLAFVVPTLQATLSSFNRNSRGVSTLVIAPTRDLALQIETEYKKVISNLPRNLKQNADIIVLTGGKKTRINVKNPPSIVVGTPGRLLDQLSNPNVARLFKDLKYRVYDEADRLLDVGFEQTLSEIDQILVAASRDKFKSILFSATIDSDVDSFAREHIDENYKYINCVNENEPEAHENIHQSLISCTDSVDTYATSFSYIANHLQHKAPFKCMVFLPTVTSTEWFYQSLVRGIDNGLFEVRPSNVVRLHGQRSQAARDNTVRHFRNMKSGIMVCTDVAARGLDFNDVTHVIQLTPSVSVADYIHKVGRTARAGKEGKAILFLTKNEQRYATILKKERGVKFEEVINSEDIEKAHATIFDQVRIDEEEIEQFITTYLSFQSQVTQKHRLDRHKSIADTMELYRALLGQPDKTMQVSYKYATEVLKLDHTLGDLYFNIPGGLSRGGGGNRKSKRDFFGAGRNSYSPRYNDRNDRGGQRGSRNSGRPSYGGSYASSYNKPNYSKNSGGSKNYRRNDRNNYDDSY